MKTIQTKAKLEIPDSVKVKLHARQITVTGPRGELKRDFRHLPLDLSVKGSTLHAQIWFGIRKDLACVRTFLSHVENLFTGVTKGFKYKMRFVYAHFPVNCSITNEDKRVEIRNFLGEKVVRIIDLLPGVTVTRSKDVKDELVLVGNDLENVSRSCALIHQSCLVKNKDIRKFLDGIYVSEKGTVVQDD